MENKFIAPPTNRAWNTFCDIHQYWWVKSGNNPQCPKCWDENATYEERKAEYERIIERAQKAIERLEH
jgi:hypothetical protein